VPIFYHVDIQEFLRPGKLVELMPAPTEGRTQAESAEMKRWFPVGVSRFGFELLCGRAETEAFLAQETTLESIRRQYYPDRPSRYTSFFAFLSVVDFERYLCQAPHKDGRIWKVEARGGFRADINLFPEWCPKWEDCAHVYWKQGQSSSPLFEYLLTPPVRALEEIGHD
jgi:hypothetical protein